MMTNCIVVLLLLWLRWDLVVRLLERWHHLTLHLIFAIMTLLVQLLQWHWLLLLELRVIIPLLLLLIIWLLQGLHRWWRDDSDLVWQCLGGAVLSSILD